MRRRDRTDGTKPQQEKKNNEALTANASFGDVCAVGTKRGSHACFGTGAREITTSW